MITYIWPFSPLATNLAYIYVIFASIFLFNDNPIMLVHEGMRLYVYLVFQTSKQESLLIALMKMVTNYSNWFN